MYRIPDFFGGKDHDFEEGGFCEVGEIFFWKIEQEKFFRENLWRQMFGEERGRVCIMFYY